jgi:hypothetical protein
LVIDVEGSFRHDNRSSNGLYHGYADQPATARRLIGKSKAD